MDAKNIEALTNLGEKFGRTYLLGLYEILSNPKTFLKSKELDSKETFVAASKFAVFISVLNLIIIYPSLRQEGVEAESPYFLIVDTVITYAFFFLNGLIFHVVAMVFRGTGTAQGSVTVYLYLTAFMPVLHLVFLPGLFAFRGLLIDSGGYMSYDLYNDLIQISLEKPMVMVSVVITFAFLVYYMKCLVSGYRILHQTGRTRGFFIVAISTLGILASEAFIESPVAAAFHKSFQE